ncbi:hypothetical protein P5673_029693 [Acropora cervicornis]|uniref:Uncharacterized protein n=1 Tax=Acropora cervicornis TaxID=6130 RepID=A0AAD9UU31_ACRCE|nr:hypothetical protein P5673_029693 [Acropora cervicornis]
MAYIRSHCHGYLCCDIFYKSIYSTFPRNVNIFFLNPTLEYGPTHCRALLYSLQMSLPSDELKISPKIQIRNSKDSNFMSENLKMADYIVETEYTESISQENKDSQKHETTR